MRYLFFLWKIFIAIISQRMVFTISHKFWKVVFHFHLLQSILFKVLLHDTLIMTVHQSFIHICEFYCFTLAYYRLSTLFHRTKIPYLISILLNLLNFNSIKLVFCIGLCIFEKNIKIHISEHWSDMPLNTEWGVNPKHCGVWPQNSIKIQHHINGD